MGMSLDNRDPDKLREVQQAMSQLIADSQERLVELRQRCQDFRQRYFRLVIEQYVRLGLPEPPTQQRLAGWEARNKLGRENTIKAWKIAKTALDAAEEEHEKLRQLQYSWRTDVPKFVYQALDRLD
jgi:hypothetical protein